MTSFEGDTGPYLQYAHARLCSIARKSGLSREKLQNADLSLLREPHVVDLLRLMAQYPDTVKYTFETLEPTTVVTYLFRLTHQLSSGYDVLKVVGASEEAKVTLARAALYEAARQVISNGMILPRLTPVGRYVVVSILINAATLKLYAQDVISRVCDTNHLASAYFLLNDVFQLWLRCCVLFRYDTHILDETFIRS